MLQIYEYENYSKWHHKFAKHNTTPRYVYYQSVFKNFAKFFYLFPRLQLLVQVSLFPYPVAWPPFLSIGSLALWLCGPLALCLFLVVCLQSMCCFLDLSVWFWSLVSLVGGLEWCYPCWDPARFVLLIPFHLFTFYLRPHVMLLMLQFVGDMRQVNVAARGGAVGIISLVLPVA